MLAAAARDVPLPTRPARRSRAQFRVASIRRRMTPRPPRHEAARDHLPSSCPSSSSSARPTPAARAATTRTPSRSTKPRRWRCWPTAWAATTPARWRAAWRPPSSRPSSAAGCTRPPATRPTPTCAARIDICVDNANRAIFNAANSNPQYAGMGTTLVVGVFRDAPAADGPRRRLARLPAARRPADADHARPFAAAGADRRRPHHARAGGVLGQQEPGDARRRRRGHGAARDRTCTRCSPATST